MLDGLEEFVGLADEVLFVGLGVCCCGLEFVEGVVGGGFFNFSDSFGCEFRLFLNTFLGVYVTVKFSFKNL